MVQTSRACARHGWVRKRRASRCPSGTCAGSVRCRARLQTATSPRGAAHSGACPACCIGEEVLGVAAEQFVAALGRKVQPSPLGGRVGRGKRPRRRRGHSIRPDVDCVGGGSIIFHDHFWACPIVTLLRTCASTALRSFSQIATSLSCATNAKPGPYGVDTACSSGTVLTTGEIHCGTNAPLRSANVCTGPA